MPSLLELLALREQAGNEALQQASHGLEPETYSYKRDIELPPTYPDPLASSTEWVRPGPNVGIKGNGFLGLLKIPGGSVASEYSIADSDKLKAPNGENLNYPSIVPTLNKSELLNVLLSATGDPHFQYPHGAGVEPSVIDKATRFAEQRAKQGKSLFASPNETNENILPEFPRTQLYLRPSHR